MPVKCSIMLTAVVDVSHILVMTWAKLITWCFFLTHTPVFTDDLASFELLIILLKPHIKVLTARACVADQ